MLLLPELARAVAWLPRLFSKQQQIKCGAETPLGNNVFNTSRLLPFESWLKFPNFANRERKAFGYCHVPAGFRDDLLPSAVYRLAGRFACIPKLFSALLQCRP